MIGSADVEPNVTVRANAPEEESNPSQFLDLILIVHAPLIQTLQRVFLCLFQGGPRLAIAQSQIHLLVGPHVIQILASSHANAIRVNEQGLLGVQAESLDIEAFHIEGEAVGLFGTDGVKLVYLDEIETSHIRLARRVQAPGPQFFLNVLLIPGRQVPLDPFDKILRGLACGQRHHALWIGLDPLQESQGCQLAQYGEMLHHQRGDLFRGGVKNAISGGLECDLLDLGQVHRFVSGFGFGRLFGCHDSLPNGN